MPSDFEAKLSSICYATLSINDRHPKIKINKNICDKVKIEKIQFIVSLPLRIGYEIFIENFIFLTLNYAVLAPLWSFRAIHSPFVIRPFHVMY